MPETSSCSLPPLYVLGAPGPVGGADTELWHALRLWREHGLRITIIPTWRIDPAWRARCEAIGCTVLQVAGPAELPDVPGIRGAVVVSFCNGAFLAGAGRLRQAGCKLVWANCMTWMFHAERRHYREHGLFDHFIFQSRHQQSLLVPQLRPYGYRDEQGSVIRGAFCFDEFPFHPRPHEPGAPLVIGRISRPDADKYAAGTWAVYRRIPHPINVRVMAWDERIQRKLGPPPPWAECLPAAAETAPEFFARLHAMLQINGGAGENWPRSGLEAMACGVPIVAQNQWGWREMIEHGRTGFLADREDELAYYAAKLAYEESTRLRIAAEARRALQRNLANPEVLWAAWRSVFERMSR